MSIACCQQGCGASVCFSPEVEARLRRTHEWWMCPFGHNQHFVAKTDQELLTEQAERIAARWRRRYEESEETFGACPVEECGWRSYSGLERRWRSMLNHFAKAHGAHGLLKAYRPLKAVAS